MHNIGGFLNTKKTQISVLKGDLVMLAWSPRSPKPPHHGQQAKSRIQLRVMSEVKAGRASFHAERLGKLQTWCDGVRGGCTAAGLPACLPACLHLDICIW